MCSGVQEVEVATRNTGSNWRRRICATIVQRAYVRGLMYTREGKEKQGQKWTAKNRRPQRSWLSHRTDAVRLLVFSGCRRLRAVKNGGVGRGKRAGATTGDLWGRGSGAQVRGWRGQKGNKLGD